MIRGVVRAAAVRRFLARRSCSRSAARMAGVRSVGHQRRLWHVAIPTPAAERTAVYRLRAGPATSGRWRVVLVPSLR